MLEFARFDQRHYPTVSVQEGYAAWEPTYETTVEDTMDLALLDRIEGIEWAAIRDAADLGCGTGRTASWLRSRGAEEIDGVDVTPEMLDRARDRSVHRSLAVADVRATGLQGGEYDLVVCSLVDEHLEDLTPLYTEARRLLRPRGRFVLLGFHPFFIMMSGMPTHFDRGTGPVAIETYVHLPSDHLDTALAVGLLPVEMHEGLIDEEWVQRKPQWERYRDCPISFACVWQSP